METIGEKIAPFLKEIDEALIKHKGPLDIPNYGFRSIINIMMLSILDKAWDLMEKECIPQNNREEMAISIGDEFRTFIHKYTGIDTHKLYDDK